MATDRSGRRRSQGSTSTHKRSSNRSKSRSASNGRRPLQGRDTGYRIGSNRRQTGARNIEPRLIIIGILAILVVIGLIFGVTSCIRGCSSSRTSKKQETTEKKVNPEDERVAYGVSADVTHKLTPGLDRAEALETIAKNANKISDERLIDLALTEPEAIEFVAGSLKADGTTQPYADAITSGEYPQLFTFDARWGYLQYADGTVGSVGSGPVALSMASMGLSGKATYDPATVAQAVHAVNLDNGTTGMDDSFLTNHGSDAGVSATMLEASSDGMYGAIAEGSPVIIKLKSDSGVGSSRAHWAIVTKLNSDNSVTVYDPTSTYASTRPWSLGAISSRTDTAYSLAAATGTAGAGATQTGQDQAANGTPTTDDGGAAGEGGA